MFTLALLLRSGRHDGLPLHFHRSVEPAARACASPMKIETRSEVPGEKAIREVWL
jgi:hypothetical protein